MRWFVDGGACATNLIADWLTRGHTHHDMLNLGRAIGDQIAKQDADSAARPVHNMEYLQFGSTRARAPRVLAIFASKNRVFCAV
jgi:hypothetical protein